MLHSLHSCCMHQVNMLLKTNYCFLGRYRNGFLLKSQPEEDFSLILQPCISIYTCLWAELLLSLRSKTLRKRYVLRCSWCADKCSNSVTSEQSEGGESSHNWRGLNILAVAFLVFRAHFLPFHCLCYSLLMYPLKSVWTACGCFICYRYFFLEQSCTCPLGFVFFFLFFPWYRDL